MARLQKPQSPFPPPHFYSAAAVEKCRLTREKKTTANNDGCVAVNAAARGEAMRTERAGLNIQIAAEKIRIIRPSGTRED